MKISRKLIKRTFKQINQCVSDSLTTTKLGNKLQTNGKPDYFMQSNRNQLHEIKWTDELWFISLTSENIQTWICFPVIFFLLCCDLQVDKCAFVNKDKTFIFFSLPDPAKIWLSTWLSYKPDGNCNWITSSYVNHCFNLFLVSKLFVLLSVTLWLCQGY